MKSDGFSLMEVCLALMIMSVGVATLFGLFPAWVKEIDYSVADAHAGLFAEYALSGMQANAAMINDWDVWSDDSDFQSALLMNLGLSVTGSDSGDAETIVYPDGSGHDLKYCLTISEVENRDDMRSVMFAVSYGSRGWVPNLFYSEFYFNHPE